MLLPRIITGALYGVVLTAVLLWGSPLAAAVVLGLLWVIGAWEWGAFARLTPVVQLAYAAVLAASALASFMWFDAALEAGLTVLALVWWLLALGLVLTYPRALGVGLGVVAGACVLWPSWLLLVRLHSEADSGATLAFTVLFIVWMADVGAYVFGRWLGRTKLAPAVSPGKTWEGVAGGLLAAALVSWGAAAVLAEPVGAFVALGIVTALASVLGDLTQSMFKRNVGLKDSGKLLPGHGGILDRIDSLTAAVPVFVAGLQLLHALDLA